MNFKFTPEQEAWRKEVEDFCKEEVEKAPEGWIGGIGAEEESEEGWAYHRLIVKKVADKGWLLRPWPKEYGGMAEGPIEQLIFQEVIAYYRVPAFPLHFNSLGAGILFYGNDEQKKEWLPRIARAEICWAECLSEPDAGSDLASLKTTAVPDGDDYVINGQKMWTTGAHHADHVFILARTDPDPSKRHRGLSFFVHKIGPGIEFRPLIYMNRSHLYNETFLDNFRVPKKDMIGELNQGWYVFTAGRQFARSNLLIPTWGRRDLEDLTEYCNQTQVNGEPLSQKPSIRQRIAEFTIEYAANLKFAYYVGWLQSEGQEVAAEAAASGWFANELNQRVANFAVEIMGLYGTVKRESKWAPLFGRFQDLCQWDCGISLAGGTTEIRKNLIARQGLNLPRG